jgi:hypothetical protein
MSRNKLAGIIIGCTIAAIVVIVLNIFHPWRPETYLDKSMDDVHLGTSIPSDWKVFPESWMTNYQNTVEEPNLVNIPNSIKANPIYMAGIDRGNNFINPCMVIETIPTNNFTSAKDVIEFNVDIYTEIFSGFRILRAIEPANNDPDQALLIYQDSNPGTVENVLSIVVVDGDTVWFVSFHWTSDQWSNCSNVINAVLTSAEFDGIKLDNFGVIEVPDGV